MYIPLFWVMKGIFRVPKALTRMITPTLSLRFHSLIRLAIIFMCRFDLFIHLFKCIIYLPLLSTPPHLCITRWDSSGMFMYWSVKAINNYPVGKKRGSGCDPPPLLLFLFSHPQLLFSFLVFFPHLFVFNISLASHTYVRTALDLIRK